MPALKRPILVVSNNDPSTVGPRSCILMDFAHLRIRQKLAIAETVDIYCYNYSPLIFLSRCYWS
ncbi:MAG: hypothetical protein K0R85_320 [Devosia sp.]|jgi:hypothetical protein|nr:hypothetical protein [Devosia sp.]